MTPPFPAGLPLARALALTTRFYHPAVQMRGWETLSRASAFLVPASPEVTAAAGLRWHVLLSAHVARPFLFPHYYDPARYPFVHVLGEDDVRCSVAVARGDSGGGGGGAGGLPLRPGIRVHPHRDVAVGHLEDEDALAAAAAAAGVALAPLALAGDPAGEGAPLAFFGHVLRGAGGGGGGDDEGGGELALVPHHAHGRLLARSPRQTFARTPGEVLEMGMCGGPVVGDDGACVGLVEGVVPSPAPGAGGGGGAGEAPAPPGEETPQRKAARLLAGAAVLIDAPDVAGFVRAVERQLL